MLAGNCKDSAGVFCNICRENPVIFTDFPCNSLAICKYDMVFPADIVENPRRVPAIPCKHLRCRALQQHTTFILPCIKEVLICCSYSFFFHETFTLAEEQLHRQKVPKDVQSLGENSLSQAVGTWCQLVHSCRNCPPKHSGESSRSFSPVHVLLSRFYLDSILILS